MKGMADIIDIAQRNLQVMYIKNCLQFLLMWRTVMWQICLTPRIFYHGHKGVVILYDHITRNECGVM